MEEALWQVAPDAGVVASASLVGGSITKLLDTLGSLTSIHGGAAAFAGGGFVGGAVSAATGALAAKAFSDRSDRLAIEERLLEMIEAVDWCLATEDRRSQESLATFAYSCVEPDLGRKRAAEEKVLQKEYRRHLVKLKQMSAPAPRGQKKSKGRNSKRLGVEGNGTGVISGLTVPGSNESYERLFNPQWGTVRSKQGICAALAYLVVQFLELKKSSRGVLQDGSRISLRLAVASLARHHAFDESEVKNEREMTIQLLQPEEEEDTRWSKPGEDQEFRSAALALLCLLDAALSWRPSDPLGWMGQAEDAEGAVLAREKGMCSFPFFASKLRKCLKKASAGCQIAWQRLEVHLDAVRARSLPEPWPWIWVLNEEASMLVRNRTKVPLRVELHRPKGLSASPWADLPLLKSLKPLVGWMFKEKPILVAEVKPGIEWALRPRAKEGREFRLRLMTKAGVMVCARGLRRGQAFDFEVPIPPAPAQLRPALNHGAQEITVKGRIKATDDAFKALGGKDSKEDDREDRGSVASTAAPSLSSGRLSFASTASQGAAALSARQQMEAKLEERRRKVEGLPPLNSEGEKEDLAAEDDESFGLQPVPEAATEAPRLLTGNLEGFRSCLCPRCLRTMPLRRTRPRASIYAGGVRCDYCKVELMGDAADDREEGDGQEGQAVGFCHCSRCWFDLCRQCAYKEMQEVMKSKKTMVKRTGAMSHGIKVSQAAPTSKAARLRSVKSTGQSPFPGFQRPTAREVRQLHTLLARHFGERRPGKAKRNILDTVVGTILSQNTTNTNSHRAFSQLKDSFPTWDKARTARPAAVQKVIRCGGLAPKKTKWIQAILKTLYKERGETSMEFLRKLDKDAVHQQLERFQGVGKKTSAIINMFDCNNPDMAVDTHVFRYALQLGWAPSEQQRAKHNKGNGTAWPAITRDTVYSHLDATFPDDLKYSMHLILTDTEGGLPVVCGARNQLGFQNGRITVDGKPLKEVVADAEL